MNRTLPPLIALLALAAPAAGQTTYTWQGGAANNSWTQAANWAGGVAPPASGNTDLVFTDVNFTGTAYVFPNLDVNYSVNGLTFASGSSFNLSTDSGRALTLGSGGIIQNSAAGQVISVSVILGADQTWFFVGSPGGLTVAGGVDTNGQTLALSGAGTNILGGVIGGSGQLQKINPGTIVLTGANTYTGGTTVVAGTLQVGNGGTAGSPGAGAGDDQRRHARLQPVR